MSNAGRAVFEAVGRFGPLIKEGQRAEDALKGVREAGEGIGTGIPANGGPAAKGLQGIANRAGELGDKMTQQSQKLTLGLTAPIAAIGVTSIRSFASFEEALTSARLKAGANEKQYARMKDLALELGATTKFSAGESATAMDLLAASGMDAEQAMDALPGVMKGAQASGEDLALTADTVSKAINAFNLEAGDAEKVSDVFAQAANTTALGMEDIAYGIANAGEVGARFDQDMTGVIAVLGRLVDQGVPAASAGVAIRSALVNLAAPTDKASGYMKTLGIEVRDAEGRMKQLPDIMQEMQAALDLQNPKLKEAAEDAGLTGRAYKDMALKQMFGVEGAKAVALAISDGKPMMLDAQKDAEKLEKLQDGLAETMGNKGAKAWIAARTESGKFVAKGADAVTAIDAMGRSSEGLSEKFGEAFSKTTAMKLDNLMGSLETLAITLVDTVAPSLNTVIEFATKLFEGFGKLAKIPGVGPLIVGMGLLLAAMGPVMFVVGNMLKAFSGVSKAAGKLKSFTGRGAKAPPATRTTTTAAGTSGGKGGAVFWTRAMPVYITKMPPQKAAPGGKGGGTTVVGGAGGAAKPAPAAKPAAGPRFGGTKAVAGGAAGGAAMGGIFAAMSGGGAGDIAKSMALFAAMEVAIMGVMKAMGALGPVVSRVFGFLGTALSKVGPIFMRLIGFVGRLGPLFLRLAPMVLRFLGPIGLVVSIAILVIKNWSKVKAVLIAIWNALKAAASAVWNAIKSAVSSAVTGTVNKVKSVMSALKGWWTGVWNGIKGAASAAWNGIKGAVTSGINAVKGVVTKVMGAIKAFWTATWNGIKAAAQAIWNGIKSTLESMLSFVRGIPDKIKGVFSGAASWLLGAGKAIIDGLLSGISDGFNAVKSKLGELTDLLPDWKGPPKKDEKILIPAGKKIMAGLVKGLQEGAGGVKDYLRDLTKQIKETFDGKNQTAGLKVLDGFRERVQKVADKWDVLQKKIEAQKTALDDAKQAYADFASSAADMVKSSLDPFADLNMDKINGQGGLLATILGNSRTQRAQAESFTSVLGELSEAGLNEDTINDLMAQGPKVGLAMAQAIKSGGAAAIQQLNSDSGAINKLGDTFGANMADQFKQSGIDSAKELLKGLKSQEPALIAHLKRLGKKIAKALDKAIKDGGGGKGGDGKGGDDGGGGGNGRTGAGGGGGGGAGGKHKWVPISNKQPKCKKCGKWRNTSVHTNRSDGGGGNGGGNGGGGGSTEEVAPEPTPPVENDTAGMSYVFSDIDRQKLEEWQKARQAMAETPKTSWEGQQWSAESMSSAAFAQMSGYLNDHVASSVPAAAKAAPMGGGDAGKTVTWAPTIVNPEPEKASDSLFKTAQKIAYLGLDGGGDD